MGFQSEFAEILKEKMGDTPLEQAAPTPEPTFKGHIFHEVFTHFVSKKTWKVHAVEQVYPKIKSKNKPQIQKENIDTHLQATTPPEIVFTQESLNKVKQQALFDFIHLGARLNTQQLTSSGIKKEYRRLLKIYHPDHSKTKQSALTFQKVIRCYRQLND